MKLKTIIERKVNNLYATYEGLVNKDYDAKLKKALNDFGLANEFLDDISKDISNIMQLETSVISKIVSESNWEMINEQLSSIKEIYVAKSSGILINLTNEQRAFYSKFKVSLQQRVEELNRMILYYNKCLDKNNKDAEKLENAINDLEGLLKRLSNPEDNELLTKEDFLIIYKIFIADSQVKDTTKKSVIREYIKYNDAILNSKEKLLDGVDLNSVKDLLKEYGVLQATIDKLDSFKEEIINNADLEKMREILEYLTLNDEVTKKRNIVNSFGESTLIGILLYGNVDHIRNIYNYQIEKYGHILGIYLDTTSLWVSNMASSKRSKKTIISGERKKMIPPLYSSAHETSIADMELNEEFLQSKGFSISIADGGNVKVLKTRHNVIRDNYQIYLEYGIINENDIEGFPLSVLSFKNVLEHLDNLVELGLLDDYIKTENPQNAYAIMYPSTIQCLTQEEVLFLYHLKSSTSKSEYYDILASKKFKGTLARTDIASMMKNEGLNKKSSDKYKEKYFVNLSDRIPNYNTYLESIYKVNLITHEESILDDSLIQELESNYKVTEYSYQFGNQIISRLKVLRNFTALRKFGYINEDALLFCITYGSYLDNETLSIIRTSLNKGGQR